MKKRGGARLGQHFLTATWAAVKLAGTAVASRNEVVLEIGPGKGALTKELLKFSDHVIAIEKDGVLIEKLRKTFKNELLSSRLTLVHADVRDVSLEKLGLQDQQYVLAANIPYYITGEIIRQFLTDAIQPRDLVLLVQKEVAQRIVSKKESILSLSVKAYGSPRIVAKVGKGSFSPPPSVDSAILAIENISRDFFDTLDEVSFFKVVRAGFSSKRKLLTNNLNSFDKENVLHAFEKCGIAEKARAEDVPLEKWGQITTLLGTPHHRD